VRSLLKSDIISCRLVVVLDHLLSILPTKKTFKKSHKKAKGKPVPAAGSSAADAELDPDSEVLDSVMQFYSLASCNTLAHFVFSSPDA